MLFGTTPQFLEHLGLDSLDELPPLGEFVPRTTAVEAMERRLRVVPEPDGPGPAGPETAGPETANGDSRGRPRDRDQ